MAVVKHVHAGDVRVPGIIAWVFFAPGVVAIIMTIVRLQVDGITVLGSVFLALWFWLLGGFTRDFWASTPRVPAERSPYPDDDPRSMFGPHMLARKHDPIDWALGPELSRLDRLDGVGNRKEHE